MSLRSPGKQRGKNDTNDGREQGFRNDRNNDKMGSRHNPSKRGSGRGARRVLSHPKQQKAPHGIRERLTADRVGWLVTGVELGVETQRLSQPLGNDESLLIAEAGHHEHAEVG